MQGKLIICNNHLFEVIKVTTHGKLALMEGGRDSVIMVDPPQADDVLQLVDRELGSFTIDTVRLDDPRWVYGWKTEDGDNLDEVFVRKPRDLFMSFVNKYAKIVLRSDFIDS